MSHPLKTYRAANDKTLVAFAGEVGTTASAISRIENGKWAPTPKLAIKIEEVTGGQVARHMLRPDLWDKPL